MKYKHFVSLERPFFLNKKLFLTGFLLRPTVVEKAMIASIYARTLLNNNIMMIMQSAITEAVRLGSQEMVVALVTLFSSTSSQPYQVIGVTIC